MPLPSLFHAGRFVQSSTRIECCISGPCFSTARPLSKKCLHLRFTSSSPGSLPARGVPCIQADLSWSSIAGVSVAHRLAVLVRALCSVLWGAFALAHLHSCSHTSPRSFFHRSILENYLPTTCSITRLCCMPRRDANKHAMSVFFSDPVRQHSH